MLTAEEYGFLWEVYRLAGIVFIVALMLFGLWFHMIVRVILVLGAVVCIFSNVTLNEAGNQAPALLVLALDTFLKVEVPAEGAKLVLAKNSIIAFVLAMTVLLPYYYFKTKLEETPKKKKKKKKKRKKIEPEQVLD